MARTRTTPESTPDVTTDYVMQFGVIMAYDEAGNPDTDNIKFVYVVNNTDGAGGVIRSQVREVKFANWPAGVKTDLKAVYNRVLTDAENAGLIGAGTDSDDLP